MGMVLAKCRNDPHRFNEVFLSRKRPSGERMRPSYWQRQREICDALVKYRTTVVYTGNMTGKDYLVGGLIPWWLCTRDNSLVIVTGPTQTVLGSITWKEVRRALAASAWLAPRISSGITTSPALVEVKSGHHALGYSTTSVERASGQHARHLLVIVEEASGVEDEIWDAIESLGYSRLLAIGNPIRAEGRFVELIRQAESDARDGIPPHLATKAIQIPSTDSPHANWDKSPYGLADRTWLEASYRRYRRDSLWVRSHIEARIPEVTADQLIPESWLDYAASQSRPPKTFEPGHPVHATRRLAVDLGEGVGRDSSCVLVRDDLGILECVVGNAIGLPEAAAIMKHRGDFYHIPPARMSYDKLGIGKGMPNQLARYGLENAVAYAGEASPSDKHGFTNLRSEAAWKLRQRLDPQHVPDMRAPHSSQPPFCIPPAAWWGRLREELRPLTYECVGKLVKLLPKKDWTEILGHSPDIADALIQSFAL